MSSMEMKEPMEIQTEKAMALVLRMQERFAGDEGQGARGGCLHGIDFKSLDGIESPEVLALLGKPRRGWLPLHRIVELLENESRYLFWNTVFENRAFIPHAELLKVWYTCHNDFERFFWYGRKGFPVGIFWTGISNASLLIENRFAAKCYEETKGRGWRFMRCINGVNVLKMRMPQPLKKAFDEDDGPMFGISCAMDGRNLCMSLLVEILAGGKVGILSHLVAYGVFQKEPMTLEELCCFCAAQVGDSQAIPLHKAIDGACPGILKDVRDPFGRNLLWYAMFNNCTAWFHPNCRLVPFLLDSGCDPGNCNQIGLSWREVRDGLSCSQKVDMMRQKCKFFRRRNHGGSFGFNSRKLKEEQPLAVLRKKQCK